MPQVNDRVEIGNSEYDVGIQYSAPFKGQHGTIIDIDSGVGKSLYRIQLDTSVHGITKWVFYSDEFTVIEA